MALTFAIMQVAVMWLFPPALWTVLTRRLHVSWSYVLLGCATWLTGLPFLFGVPYAATRVFGATPLVWFVALAVTAGIAEETSRYLYYRRSAVLRDTRNWNVAVVAGAAHGGVESIVLGVQALFGLIAVFFLPEQVPGTFRAAPPPAMYYALGTLLRVLIIISQIGFTLLVWQAVSRQRLSYYATAVLIHIAVDLIAFCQPILLPGYDWISWLTLLALFAGALRLIRESRPIAAVRRPREPQTASG